MLFPDHWLMSRRFLILSKIFPEGPLGFLFLHQVFMHLETYFRKEMLHRKESRKCKTFRSYIAVTEISVLAIVFLLFWKYYLNKNVASDLRCNSKPHLFLYLKSYFSENFIWIKKVDCDLRCILRSRLFLCLESGTDLRFVIIFIQINRSFTWLWFGFLSSETQLQNRCSYLHSYRKIDA